MADANVVSSKVCTKCGERKPATIEFYPPHSMGRYGFHPYCRPCKRADDAAARSRDDQKRRQKAWRDANKDYTAEYNRRYRLSGKKSLSDKEYREANKDKLRAADREKRRRMRANDPALRLKERIASRLRMMLKGKAGRTTESLLGYSMVELRDHIERQFMKGMNWDNMGEWHIDHIRPVSLFKISTENDPHFRECWALTNLRPVWASENLKKGARRTLLI